MGPKPCPTCIKTTSFLGQEKTKKTFTFFSKNGQPISGQDMDTSRNFKKDIQFKVSPGRPHIAAHLQAHEPIAQSQPAKELQF